VPVGSSWSFNATFGGGPGYKQASGVLAGGQCALATAFRAAALKAGLPAQSIPHLYPVPGFTHSETVTIWWGTYDLKIENPTGQALSLVWKLTPAGVDVSIMQ
jgi:vancomycin resistance protein YoaR